MKLRYSQNAQLPVLWIVIGMISMWPFEHISPHFLGFGFLMGAACVGWIILQNGAFFGTNDRYPYRLLYGKKGETGPRVYSCEINQATLPSDFFFDAFMSIFGFNMLGIVTVLQFGGLNVLACILMYASVYPAMHMLRMVRCMRRTKLKATCAWQTNGYHIFWVLPSLEWYMLPLYVNVYLVACPTGEAQPSLSYAISDRSASLYLVSANSVIPVCYDQEGNQAAIEQLKNVTLQREAPVIELNENPMPKTVLSGVLTKWVVGLWIGFYFLFMGFYHIAGGDPQIALQVLPLVSFVAVWIGLEIYSQKLRREGYARLRKAAGL